MSIFTERDDDRMDKALARNSIERRDALIEELADGLRLLASYRCAPSFLDSVSQLVEAERAIKAMREMAKTLFTKVEREGYGQTPDGAA